MARRARVAATLFFPGILAAGGWCAAQVAIPPCSSAGSSLRVARDPVTDIAFTEPERSTPYGACTFASGWTDPEQVLDPSWPPLIFYQLEGAGARIFLAKQGRTVRITTF